MRLEGKRALITGGGRGIGRACARRFVAEGASVVLGDILLDEGRAVAAELTQAGGKATFVECDGRMRGRRTSRLLAVVDHRPHYTSRPARSGLAPTRRLVPNGRRCFRVRSAARNGLSGVGTSFPAQSRCRRRA